MKSIILCADDFGFSSEVSEAILTLLKNKRLNATSCMVNAAKWNEYAAELKSLKEISIGLHFTLTDVPPIQMPQHSLSDILKKSFLRQLNQANIEKEMRLQIERFKKAIGRLPDFIDGHQHIHQLPIIRDATLSVYKKIFSQTQHPYIHSPYIRVPISKPHTIKSWIIAHIGALTLKKMLMKNDIPYNKSFSGVYDFSIKKNYSQTFTQFLKSIESGGLIMCHPGYAYANTSDPIAKAREQEFEYLNSPQFLDDCRLHNITLAPITF